MADHGLTTENSAVSGRLMSSVTGMVLGALLFAASLGILHWNEGRFELSALARGASEVSAIEPGAADLAGRLVSVTGNISGSEPIGDGLFLKPGTYVAIKRVSEMYAWTEKSETHMQKSLGGSESKATSYEYAREWRAQIEDSSRFHDPEGHKNPENAVPSREVRAASAAIGTHRIEINGLELPFSNEIRMSADNFMAAPGGSLAEGGYVFRGKGSLGAPMTGDLRIKYYGLKNRADATVFGKIGSGGEIESYTHENGVRFFRVFEGSRDAAVAQLKSKVTILSWTLRGLCLGMMWLALSLGSFTGTIALPVSLTLTSMTILVSNIMHNPVAMVFVAFLIFAIAVRLFHKKRVERTDFEQVLRRAA